MQEWNESCGDQQSGIRVRCTSGYKGQGSALMAPAFEFGSGFRVQGSRDVMRSGFQVKEWIHPNRKETDLLDQAPNVAANINTIRLMIEALNSK